MNDLISREAVRDLMYHNQVYHNESILSEYDLDSIPSVDAVPVVHGHWNKFNNEWECSNCGETISMRRYMEDRMFFCNACGAKMDEE